MKSVKVVLRNYQTQELIDYTITPEDNQLAQDWMQALEQDILKPNLHLEKNFCFHGFPYTQRNLPFLCNEINKHIRVINMSDLDYLIEEYFCEDVVRFDAGYPQGKDSPGLKLKHTIMNALHNHFEVLQGTVDNPSPYFEKADANTKYAIRQLNNICHEIESLVLSQRKIVRQPAWVRPSQITTFLRAPRHNLTPEHRKGFTNNGYDREFGSVYMHWCQIGKTLYEVFRDEHAPHLDAATCEAITHLKFYSGEFDIEWGNSITWDTSEWHREEIENFHEWLIRENMSPTDLDLSLGYLKIGQVNYNESFGTNDSNEIWRILGDHLDIYQIECNGVSATYKYHWSNDNHENLQLGALT